MLRILPFLILFIAFSAQAQSQDQPQPLPQTQSAPPPQSSNATDKKPQVRYNYLNVCTPTEAEQQQMKAVLARVPGSPQYNADFEISRGRTSMEKAEPARYLRLRRELSNSSEFDNVQYSLSTDATDTHETLVLKLKDPKDVLLVSLEDKVSSSASSPLSLLDVDTPVTHIKLERFGKPSLVLARCEGSDQTAFAPMFKQASQIFANYRKSLGLRGMFRNDLNWLVTSGMKVTLKSGVKTGKLPAKSSNPVKANQPKSEPPKAR